MSTPQQDLNVGASSAYDMLDGIGDTLVKMAPGNSRVLFWAGLIAGLAGGMAASIGKADAISALKAAIRAVEMEKAP